MMARGVAVSVVGRLLGCQLSVNLAQIRVVGYCYIQVLFLHV